MQKASLRSPLYTFLLPLLSFCFPPPPGTPRVKFKVQELQESFYALSNTPCILPAWRTESQWSSFTYPRRSPSLTPSTKWQNVQRKKSLQMGGSRRACVKRPWWERQGLEEKVDPCLLWWSQPWPATCCGTSGMELGAPVLQEKPANQAGPTTSAHS